MKGCGQVDGVFKHPFEITEENEKTFSKCLQISKPRKPKM